MSITVVTSCSAKGWLEYGKRFIETFAEYWPPSVQLLLFSEDPEPVSAVRAGRQVGQMRATAFDLLRASRPAKAFLERHADDVRAQGRKQEPGQIGWTPNKVAAGYNFRYDAVRFSKKVFAIAAAAQVVTHGRLFWVDADVVTFEPVPFELLPRMLPDGFALSCLDRGTYHSECGFVGYNLEHPETRPFIAAFAGRYALGEVFRFEEWHDSWVFDWLRRARSVPTHLIPHRSNKQPFINSELGRYMDHLKGNSKGLGRSPVRHMVAGHDHRYWRAAG